MLITLLIVLSWVFSGLLAVYVAGVVDRVDLQFTHGSAPFKGLFYFGPFGLAVSVVFLVISLIEVLIFKLKELNFTTPKIVSKIYDLGYKSEE